MDMDTTKSTTRFQESKKVWLYNEEASKKATVPIYEFQLEPGVAKGTSPYAPVAKGSLYVGVQGFKIDHMFSGKIGGPEKDLYFIPICFLRALAENTFPWPEPADKLGKPYDDLDNNPFKFNKCNKNFSTAAKYKSEFEPHATKECWVPIRDKEGVLILRPHTLSYGSPLKANMIKLGWKIVLKEIKLSNTGSGNRAARYQTVPAGVIKIRIMKAAEDRFRHRTGGAKAVFETYIDKVNEEKGKNLAELELLVENAAAGPPDGYILLSQHPFGLYTSYISKTGHDSYMKSLLSGCFKGPNDDSFALKRAVETRPVPTRNNLNRLQPSNISIQKKGKVSNDMQTLSKQEVKKSDTNVRKKDKDEFKTTNVIRVPLSAGKINKASGERKSYGVDDQNTVMGGKSASKIAVEDLKWKWIDPSKRLNGDNPEREFNTYQMKNSLYVAEWLHLSAFSWGGLLSTQADSRQFPSSQIYENLVIGTSEANSAMTRFEKAWQKLIRNEDELYHGNEGKLTGSLIITRHPMKRSPVNPVLKPYERPELEEANLDEIANPNEVVNPKKTAKPNLISPIPAKPRPYYKDAISNGEYIIKQEKMGNDEVAIARDFRWICYQFDYFLKLNEASQILEAISPECRVTFYPFMRMLFHKVEHDLDKLLWDDMFKEAKGQIDRSGKPVPRKQWPKFAVDIKKAGKSRDIEDEKRKQKENSRAMQIEEGKQDDDNGNDNDFDLRLGGAGKTIRPKL